MVQLMNWLVGNGIDRYWVDAMDYTGANDVMWMTLGQNVYNGLWMIGEPVHGNGDCVFLDVNGGLGMDNCDMTQYPLCQLLED